MIYKEFMVLLGGTFHLNRYVCVCLYPLNGHEALWDDFFHFAEQNLSL